MYYHIIHRQSNNHETWTISVNGDLIKVRRGYDTPEESELEPSEGWEHAPESMTGQAYASQIITEKLDSIFDDLHTDVMSTIEFVSTDAAHIERRSIAYTVLEDRAFFVEFVNGHIWDTDEFQEGAMLMVEIIEFVKQRIMTWIENEMKVGR